MKMLPQPALVIGLVLFLVWRAFAQKDELPTLPADYFLPPNKKKLKLEPWQIGRVFHGSNEAPIARLLQTQPEAVDGARHVLRFLRRVEIKMNEIQRNATASNASVEKRHRVCNVPCCYPRYDSARFVLSRAHFGILPEKDCVTDIEHDGTTDHMAAIAAFTRGLKNVAMNVSNAMLGNWSDAEAHSRFTYKTEFHKCTMERISGKRVDGHWSIAASITNAPGLTKLAEWKRHYYLEHLVFRANGQLDAFPGYAPKKSGHEKEIVNTTTNYQMWGGAMDTSSFGYAPIEENYAIKAALEASELLRAQAEDSTTPSNILILVLPLVMVLVPIGVFAVVGYWITLGYALVTDLMTTLPLAIKGVELLWFASAKTSATRTFIFAMQNSTALGAAEVWSAECTAGSKMRNIGITLLTIALLGMSLGLTLEVIAWKRVRRKMSMGKANENNPLLGEVEYLWERIPPCPSCPCGRRDTANLSHVL